MHFKLRDDGIRILRGFLERQVVGERFRGDYDAAGVHGRVAGDAFQFFRRVENALRVVIRFIQIRELHVLHRFFEILVEGDELRELVAEAVTDAEGAAPADWVRAAVAAFVQGGDDEAWTRVISAAQGAEDPALSALAAILKSRLVPAKATFTLIRRR